MRGKQNKSQPQQSTHTWYMYFVDANQEKQNLPKASHVGRQQATRQQEANFTLNCWIQAAKINSKVKLILGLRKPTVPSRVPGPEQAFNKYLMASEMNGWKGKTWEAGVKRNRRNQGLPGGWDCGWTQLSPSRKVWLLLWGEWVRLTRCLANFRDSRHW